MTILPDHILQKIDPADRKKMGKAGVTFAEADAKRDHREEIQLHKELMSWCNRNGFKWLYPSHSKKSSFPVGWPDLTIFGRGRTLFIECKSTKGKLTEEQWKMHEHLQNMGFTVLVIRDFWTGVTHLKQFFGVEHAQVRN